MVVHSCTAPQVMCSATKSFHAADIILVTARSTRSASVARPLCRGGTGWPAQIEEPGQGAAVHPSSYSQQIRNGPTCSSSSARLEKIVRGKTTVWLSTSCM